jgi:hypothetical protein
MSNNEKDRLGDKLHDVEAARENEWARRHDQELLEKIRQRLKPGATCPECKEELVPNADQGIGGMVCPKRHGAWFGWDTVLEIMEGLAQSKK